MELGRLQDVKERGGGSIGDDWEGCVYEGRGGKGGYEGTRERGTTGTTGTTGTGRKAFLQRRRERWPSEGDGVQS